MERFVDITTDELRRRLEQDPGLLVVDLRDRHKYTGGHIQGAVSFPMKPNFWEKLLKKRALKRLLGHDFDRAIAFY